MTNDQYPTTNACARGRIGYRILVIGHWLFLGRR
jgi:hypothetical protein